MHLSACPTMGQSLAAISVCMLVTVPNIVYVQVGEAIGWSVSAQVTELISLIIELVSRPTVCWPVSPLDWLFVCPRCALLFYALAL